jgi:hypothetical protein
MVEDCKILLTKAKRLGEFNLKAGGRIHDKVASHVLEEFVKIE